MTRDEFRLVLALGRARRKLRKLGCNVHIFQDGEGFVTTEFLPVCEQRESWVRVRVDGVIECGRTNRRLGTLKEYGL